MDAEKDRKNASILYRKLIAIVNCLEDNLANYCSLSVDQMKMMLIRDLMETAGYDDIAQDGQERSGWHRARVFGAWLEAIKAGKWGQEESFKEIVDRFMAGGYDGDEATMEKAAALKKSVFG